MRAPTAVASYSEDSCCTGYDWRDQYCKLELSNNNLRSRHYRPYLRASYLFSKNSALVSMRGTNAQGQYAGLNYPC